MIDISKETFSPPPKQQTGLPRRRRGRKTHVSTLYRWTVSGYRGEKLAHLNMCGHSVTFSRSHAKVLRSASRERRDSSTNRTVTQRQRESEAAAKELERRGC